MSVDKPEWRREAEHILTAVYRGCRITVMPEKFHGSKPTPILWRVQIRFKSWRIVNNQYRTEERALLMAARMARKVGTR